jgi:hypothetical protein
VRGALNGVTVTDAALIETERLCGATSWKHKQGEQTRALEVSYRHGKSGKGRTVFYDRCASRDGQAAVRVEMRKWAAHQRELRAKAREPKLSVKARQAGVAIRRLEKEKGEYCYATPESCRKTEFEWHEQKPMRKQIANIAGQVLKRQITNGTAYSLLRKAGFEVRKFSDLRKWEKVKVDEDQDEYWRHIHFFVGGVLSGPHREGRIADHARRKYRTSDETEPNEFERHAKARVEYVAASRLANSIDAQIAALKHLASGGEDPPPLLVEV